jgi:hypothetical protein
MTRRILILATTIIIALGIQAQSNSASRYADHSKLASGRWVKIRVNDEGVYQITRSQLTRMGFTNPEKVSLYGYNTPIMPETKLESMSDDMTEIPLWRRNDGSLLFYSLGTVKWEQKSRYSYDFKHTNNPYSLYVYYFLTEKEDGSPAEMSVETSTSIANTVTSTFPEHTLIEKDEVSLFKSGRSFFENYNYASGNKKSYTLSTPGIADSKVILTVDFVGGANASTLSITAGDTTFSALSLRKLVEYEYGYEATKTVTWKKDLAETSTVTLTHNRASGTAGYLNYIQASYTRKLDLSNVKYLAFRPTTKNAMQYAISGANANTHVWRVTTPETTCEIKGELTGTTYTANTNASDKINEYVAVDVTATYPEPEIVGAIDNQDLHALKDIDYVIIVPANGKLREQAQRLADAHTAKDSMRCVVVRADEIYNEFSSGTPDATAYRRFMKMLYDKAATEADRPKNLCLFGDGVWDNRMVTSALSKNNPDDYLLCYESEGSLSQTDSYVAEEYYTLLADGKGVSPLKETPDCGVGRITVTTAEQAKAVVNKLISYLNNEHTGSWKNTICIMADDGNANIHMKDAEAVSTVVEQNSPNYKIKKIYWDTYQREESGAGHSYTSAQNDIKLQMEKGALIMNYTGHGSAYILSHEQVIKRADFETLDSPNLPLWFFAACDVTPFDMNEENIGETALQNEKGGALCTVGTTRAVYSSQNRKLNGAFMKYVLANKSAGQQYSIGEALAKAKADIVNEKSYAKRDSINKCHFMLIGDPAMTLAMPTYKVKIDSFNNKSVPQAEIDTIGAGAVVSVSGHIEDEDGNLMSDFMGTISPIVSDSKELVTCLNNAGEDITPYTFYDRTKALYEGSDSVRQGQFAFTFPVPLDINYSDETGLINMYAVNTDNTIEANGVFDDFAIGGTSPTLADDTNGPTLTVALNGVEFTNKQEDGTVDSDIELVASELMHETPFFTGLIEDENGINTIGSGIGHDITLVIDNEESMTYNLNDNFEYVTNSWTQGTVSYSLPELATGQHTLLFRAWDILNNPSCMTIQFNVEEGLKPNILDFQIQGPVNDQLTLVIENDRPQSALDVDVRIYDMSGRQVCHVGETNSSSSNYYTFTCNLNAVNSHLTPGVYICKASIATADGLSASKSKKFLVAQ